LAVNLNDDVTGPDASLICRRSVKRRDNDRQAIFDTYPCSNSEKLAGNVRSLPIYFVRGEKAGMALVTQGLNQAVDRTVRQPGGIQSISINKMALREAPNLPKHIKFSRLILGSNYAGFKKKAKALKVTPNSSTDTSITLKNRFIIPLGLNSN
jgi:hypothetical protein